MIEKRVKARTGKRKEHEKEQHETEERRRDEWEVRDGTTGRKKKRRQRDKAPKRGTEEVR